MNPVPVEVKRNISFAVEDRIGIIGIGLIGASLGLSLKKRNLCGKITGFGRNKETLQKAKEIGAVDQTTDSLEEIANNDIIFLAVPVLSIVEVGKNLARYVENAIVADVGSTKKIIVDELSLAIPKFIGCHPMAGSHKKGPEFAKDGLFKDAVVVITPIEKTDIPSKNTIKNLWEKLDAKIIEISPDEHDRLVSLSSHIPHIVSNILVELVGKNCLISSGFHSMARLALSDPLLWRDIFITNRENIIIGLEKMEKNIVKWKDIMNDEKALMNHLDEINRLAKEVFYGED
ncbi:TPA: hypothetical protein DCX16_03925 [bacterium]|nr:hypothetical protein [bacterium]